MSDVDQIKELLGLSSSTSKEDMSEHHRKIIEEVENQE